MIGSRPGSPFVLLLDDVGASRRTGRLVMVTRVPVPVVSRCSASVAARIIAKPRPR